MENQIKILQFKSEQFNPFAPHWDYLLCETLLEQDLSPLKEEILLKEKEIIDKYEFEDDWGTKLGRNSLTARSNKYNLLEFDNAAPLREGIREVHDVFISELGLPYQESIFVQCWANVMRKNQQIQVHCHGFGPHAYLSGHVCVQVDGTNTNYYNPYAVEPFSSENVNNKITLFPTWLKHGTDRWEKDGERITIAFDIMTHSGYHENVDVEMKHHWVRL